MYVDTNIFYNVLFSTEYAERSLRVLEEAANPVTSYIVINELVYVVVRKAAADLFGAATVHGLRRRLAAEGYGEAGKYVGKALDLVRDAGVDVIEDYHDMDEWSRVMLRFGLLPSDAQIALTCRHYGIGTIATFDEDFRRVPWLRVVP